MAVSSSIYSHVLFLDIYIPKPSELTPTPII
nr:MAG TPA: hypothetical protein [Caudoviricetes sp.]